ncbi:TonB-dependent receptor domain-containing protein [uncultured Sphingomonas sp.]|uniref:TonB-dependent receptor domain-containing protein n=1 Tax=uncultured Sphingomonas sp. TaxID=158754 RepID=UPI0035CA613E
MSRSGHRHLLLTVLLGSTAWISSAALAQDATDLPGTQSPGSQASSTAGPEANTPAAPVTTTNDNQAQETGGDIVVTGSLFRRTNDEQPSPITTLSAESLARRGIITPADAIRSLSSDNSGSVPLSFTGGFANGASGVSLRGLSVNSTLVLFDGLRGAYYPLADDGQRNFVDLNTIPNIAIDRIEVLRDGASSTYGADAIGGVVNVITKKEFSGFQASGQAGVSERGDAAEQRFTALIGTGSLEDDRWNVYAGGEYYRADPLANSARGFPFNTGDLSSLTCGTGATTQPCINGNPGASTAGATTSAVVRPATQPDPNNPFNILNAGAGTFQVLNPSGCGAGTIPRSTAAGSNFCEQDIINQYSQILPEQERIGVTAKGTVALGDDVQAYASATYFQSRVSSTGTPSTIRSTSPVYTANTVLPVYVCAAGTDCATATDRQLNPNNPFAATGQAAQIYYRFGDISQSSETLSRTYRGALGVHGTVGDGWRISADVTGMYTDLDRTGRGYLNVPGLTAAINTGAYNFSDPSQNTAAIREQISPTIRTPASSELYMGQITVTKDLFELPGGPLQLGVGGSVRYEAIDAPSANPNNQTITLNGYSANGDHWIEGAFFELNAPVLNILDVNLSGRYDHYSEGYSRFSPKIGAKLTPIPELAIRGTYSQGFRAPQFAETTGSVVGFTTTNPGSIESVCTQHGGTFTSGSCAGGSAYTNPYSIGFFSVGNPDLRPEKSRSFTVGAVFQPVRWFSATVDYFNVRKTDVISAGPLSSQALDAYYAGTALPPGYTYTLNAPDPDFPQAIRTVSIVNSPFQNAAAQLVDGIDFTASVQLPVASEVRFSSSLEVTALLRSNFTPGPGEQVQRCVGTQGPYITSSGAGTPRWRGNWSNTIDAGPATLTATAYYTSGYRSTAEDQNGAGTGSDCSTALYDPAFCRTKEYIQVDLVGSVKAGDNFTFYVNVINALDEKPPFNPANYAAVNYNPTYSFGGIIGRTFRAGAKVSF